FDLCCLFGFKLTNDIGHRLSPSAFFSNSQSALHLPPSNPWPCGYAFKFRQERYTIYWFGTPRALPERGITMSGFPELAGTYSITTRLSRPVIIFRSQPGKTVPQLSSTIKIQIVNNYKSCS